jgi:tetratricopeptide (TPR) repeat protein
MNRVKRGNPDFFSPRGAGIWQVESAMTFRHAIVLAAMFGLTACQKEELHVRLAPADALAAGWDDYRLSEFDRATASFEQAIAGSETNSEIQLQARYALATVWNLRRPGEDRAKAEAIYRGILDAKPSLDLTAWTSLARSRMKHLVPVGEEPNIGEVRRAYQDIMDRFPGHLAAKEAFIYKMSTFVATLEPQQTRYAIASLSRYVSQPGQKAFLQPAWSLMSVGYTTLKMPEQRMAAEIRALQTMEIDPSNPFNEFGWAYWNIAAIAEFDVGDFSTARYYYRKMLAEYPHDVKVFGAKQELARMDALEVKIRSEIPPAPPPNSKSQKPSSKQISKPKSKMTTSASTTLESDKTDRPLPVRRGEERGEGSVVRADKDPSPLPSPRCCGARETCSTRVSEFEYSDLKFVCGLRFENWNFILRGGA